MQFKVFPTHGGLVKSSVHFCYQCLPSVGYFWQKGLIKVLQRIRIYVYIKWGIGSHHHGDWEVLRSAVGKVEMQEGELCGSSPCLKAW